MLRQKLEKSEKERQEFKLTVNQLETKVHRTLSIARKGKVFYFQDLYTLIGMLYLHWWYVS